MRNSLGFWAVVHLWFRLLASTVAAEQQLLCATCKSHCSFGAEGAGFGIEHGSRARTPYQRVHGQHISLRMRLPFKGSLTVRPDCGPHTLGRFQQLLVCKGLQEGLLCASNGPLLHFVVRIDRALFAGCCLGVQLQMMAC